MQLHYFRPFRDNLMLLPFLSTARISEKKDRKALEFLVFRFSPVLDATARIRPFFMWGRPVFPEKKPFSASKNVKKRRSRHRAEARCRGRKSVMS